MTSSSAGFEGIQPGLTGSVRLVVAEEHTAQHIGSGGVKVLATPQMVLLVEQAGVAAVDHLLPKGYCTVGAHLDVRHLAPTPIGFEVRATVELTQVDGRWLTFCVQVCEGPFDEAPPGEECQGGELVGDGTHQRVIVNLHKFSERLAQKTG